MIKVFLYQLAKHSPETIFIVASDPVDVLTYVTWRLSNFPKEHIIGTGTMMDTARFRYLLSDKLGVAPTECSAYIIGEHGQENSGMLVLFPHLIFLLCNMYETCWIVGV